jgi:hypothetical protein
MMNRSQQACSAVLQAIRSAAQLEVLGPHRRIDHALDIRFEQPLDCRVQSLDHPTIITSRCDTQAGPSGENFNIYGDR